MHTITNQWKLHIMQDAKTIHITVFFKMYSDINIRVLQLGPVHPSAQEHIPGDTHVPPL